MEASFWHERWRTNNTPFHENQANPLLVKHFGRLGLSPGSRVFVPLCGKTLDISWLLDKGYRVAGAELSEIAIEQLFEGLGIKPNVAKMGEILHYGAPDIDIFVGDIFAVSKAALGQVDAVYDRAALVALPTETRSRYVTHLLEITNHAPQLLLCYEYDQSVTNGPPFSVSNDEVREHYRDAFELTLFESVEVPGGLRGKVPATEHVWLLAKRGDQI
ncbi:MAG: thiopurine S-methyltransferase [Planctomycetota bacterium]